MDGFRQPLFKLNVTKQPEGSCTNKLIPHSVNIDCLPSTQITAETESISTLQELQESLKKGIDISGSVGLFSNKFSYSYSRETRSAIDDMFQTNSTIFMTRATISWVRLSAFTPLLELSDEFRYVIENMPCCNESAELNDYIREFVIDYFGLAYVKDLLLGGVAQQKVVISEENRRNMQTNGFTITNNAELMLAAGGIFSASAGIKTTEQYDQNKLNVFKRFSHQSSLTTLGGSTALQSVEDWSKIVPSNPTIIKFTIKPILELLTRGRFPSDSNIALKRAHVQRVQRLYENSPAVCFENCTSPTNGICVATDYFGFGQCRCNPGWTGISCGIQIQRPITFSGLICGLRTGAGHDCGGGNNIETTDCISDYNRNLWLIGPTGTGRMWFCSKNNIDNSVGPVGTVCGLTVGSGGNKCGGMDPFSEGCPNGYERYEWLVAWGDGRMSWCYKTEQGIEDLPGTVCGFQTNNGDTGPTCNGYYPARGACPAGYTLVIWAVRFGNDRLAFCLKQ